MTTVGAYAYVWLAKEGHSGIVGFNLLEKMQLPILEALYGAMLAGVDCVLMGAGIPTQIPPILDELTEHHEVSYRIAVDGALPEDDFRTRFDPATIIPSPTAPLKRPAFLAIVSSFVLAKMLQKKAPGTNGFVVEAPTAGGHNAPPRGKQEDERHQPIYDAADEVDFSKMKELGLPYWVAGSYASPEALNKATSELGAKGVQVGSIFALCAESGMDEKFKTEMRRLGYSDDVEVITSNQYSPTGFPFKGANLAQTVVEEAVYRERRPICDIAALRKPHRNADGTIEYRCPAEPVKAYVAKGGEKEDTEGKRCLCNGLLAAVGLAQTQTFAGSPTYLEPAIVTIGDDLTFLKHIMKDPTDTYTAQDVIKYLLGSERSARQRDDAAVAAS
jgi:NAD(P)H-dependent flavin oxidoreductase YrpB (nitropropane dioxygenase family)